MVKLRDTENSDLGDFETGLSEFFFKFNTFGITSVNTKTFILMLAQKAPRSFISGAPVDLGEKLKDANRTEFHHLMPRKFVKDSGQADYLVNTLANFAFLSRSDNRELGGEAPSRYKSKMRGNIDETLNHGMVPPSLFGDNLAVFHEERCQILTKFAAELCEIPQPPGGIRVYIKDVIEADRASFLLPRATP